MASAFWIAIPGVRLFQWIGWKLRTAVSSVGQEIDFLSTRAKASSGPEKSAWLFRAVVASALVVGECLILRALSIRPNSIWTLVTAWVILALLPRPTPRIPLFAARWVALIALLLNLNAGFGTLKKILPAIRSWEGSFAILWWSVAAALAVWGFLALRPQRPTTSTGPA